MKALTSQAWVCCLLLTASGFGAEPTGKFIPTFAVKYGSSSGWPALEDVARFDLIVIGAGSAQAKAHPTIPGNTWQVLKALNPHQLLLLYEIGPGEYNTASWGRIGQGWEWVTAEHGPGSADRWTAIGANSGQCLQGRAYANERLMVPGNLAWQQYWLDNVYAKHWGDSGKADAVADGVFSDNTSFSMPFQGNWYAQGHPESPDVATDYYSDGRYNAALYHQHIKSFFARAFPWLAMKKLKLGLNFGDMARHPENWEELDAMPDAPLAAMEEGAFVHPWGGKGSFVFWSEKEWLNQVRAMEKLRHVRALMNVHGPVSSDEKGIGRMDAGDAKGNRAWDVLWYALTSFLQGMDDDRRNACMSFTVWGYTEFHWFKEFDPRYLHLGDVRGPSRRADGRQGHVYLREFDDGWAVINPTDKPAADVAVPDGEARVIDHDALEQPESRPPVRRFELPAHRGVVLLRTGKAIGNSDNPM